MEMLGDVDGVPDQPDGRELKDNHKIDLLNVLLGSNSAYIP